MAKNFDSKYEIMPSGCWEWRRFIDRRGYGYVWHEGNCWNTLCVNPGHLQLLTPEQNSARQRQAFSDTCRKGHRMDEANTYIAPDRLGRSRDVAEHATGMRSGRYKAKKAASVS